LPSPSYGIHLFRRKNSFLWRWLVGADGAALSQGDVGLGGALLDVGALHILAAIRGVISVVHLYSGTPWILSSIFFWDFFVNIVAVIFIWVVAIFVTIFSVFVVSFSVVSVVVVSVLIVLGVLGAWQGAGSRFRLRV